jgi:hypothetical protein
MDTSQGGSTKKKGRDTDSLVPYAEENINT